MSNSIKRFIRRGLVPIVTGAILVAGPVIADSAGRVLVIGATAKSSHEIILQSLAAGYEVIGLARRPDALNFDHPNFRAVSGDVYDQASLAAHMTGSEVVISMVGPRVDPMKEVEFMDLYTVGTGNIIAAMKAKGNRRLVVASSLAVENEFPTSKPAEDDLGRMWIWNARRLYQDMAAMEVMVRESGIDYVIVRPPFLVEEPLRGDLEVAVDELTPKGRMLTYADFGQFVVAQVKGNSYLNKTVGLYSERELQWGKNADFDALAKEAEALREEAANP